MGVTLPPIGKPRVEAHASATTTLPGDTEPDWWQREPVWIEDSHVLLQLELFCFLLYVLAGALAILLWLRSPRPVPKEEKKETTRKDSTTKKEEKDKDQEALGQRMRRLLAMGMAVASACRCLSLLAEIGNKEGELEFLQQLGHRQVQWLWDLISLFPAVVFMSAFSIIASFWAQLHYIVSVVSLPLLDCFVVWLNIACYFLVLAVAVGTYLLCAYEHLRAYLSCIIGFLYATLAWSLLYYGIMIMSQLGDALRRGHSAKLPFLRVALVSVVCPLMLLIRAACMLCWGCSMAPPSTSVDLVLCLFSEWLPAVIILLVIIPWHSFTLAEDLAVLDSDSEGSVVGLQEPLLERREDAENWCASCCKGLGHSDEYRMHPSSCIIEVNFKAAVPKLLRRPRRGDSGAPGRRRPVPAGMRVLELASVLAGPCVGQFFAELGAEVIKVENLKTGGDVTRGWRLRNDGDTSSYFACCNQGKRSLAVDATLPSGRDLCRRLAEASDVVPAPDLAGAMSQSCHPDGTNVGWNSKGAERPGCLSARMAIIRSPQINDEKGQDVRLTNILAAKAVADTVRTSLGPKGMDKMIQEPKGEVLISNDGATILSKLKLQHPTAKMMAELSKAQDIEAGDGTTSVVVIAGALLGAAEQLLKKGIHPQTITEAFLQAAVKAEEILEAVAQPVDLADREHLLQAAVTSLNSKVVSQESETLAPIAVDAVLKVTDPKTATNVDLNDIRLVKKLGATTDDTELIDGLVLTQRVSRSAGGPARVQDAKIGLIQFCLSAPKTDMESNIQVRDYAQMDRLLREERTLLAKMVKQIAKTGCNVLLVQKSILRDAVTDLSLDFCAKAKIMVVKDIERDDIEFISKILGVEAAATLDTFSAEKLAKADLVMEEKLGSELGSIVRFTGLKGSTGGCVSVLVRASNQMLLDETERSIHDALCVVRSLVKKKALIAGGAAPEMEITQKLDSWARSVGGIFQVCIQHYAEALELVPYTLAENAGMQPVEIVTQLRAAHAKGEKYAGINVKKGCISDMFAENVVQPLLVSTSAISMATETVRMILKIDDIVLVR
ncbi:unnamed protein product [Effrenium voratum]|nr:unnamed protein product [Effrenium voratum]